MAERPPKVITKSSGPWTGVSFTQSPFTPRADRLFFADNGRLLSPDEGGGFYARPGFARPTSITNGGNPSQGVTSLTGTDGVNYNFLFVNGKVWRWATDLTSSPVDVTPTNVVISTGKFVYATALAGQLIVNDGVNKPWIGTSLGSTPIVATVIEQQTPATLLSIGSTDVRLANSAFTYTLRAGGSIGTQATFAANAVGTAVGALGQIAADTWGIILVELNDSPALVFTAAFNGGSGYATEALAIAARPARTASRWFVGYVTVRADAGAVWIAGTDAFAGGSTGNQAQTTNYYAGEGPAYSVFGQPVIYYGAVFWIYQQVEATYARTTIGWSEPNEPAVGYQQTDYDNQWTLEQTSADPLYALAATNDALYYFRQSSIGAVAGAPGVNFQGTATHDVVSGVVGCIAPRTVVVYLAVVYFCDMNGRPWRFAVGGTPDPIWKQLLQSTGSPVTVPSGVARDAWAVLEPNLNLYIAAPFPQAGTSGGAYVYVGPPTTLFIFDAETGVLHGEWIVAGTPVLEVGGIVRDANAGRALAILQGNSAGSAFVWRLYREWEQVWTDNSVVPSISITISPLIYDGAATYRAQQVRLLHGYDNGGSGGVPSVSGSVFGPAQATQSLAAKAATASTQPIDGRTVWALDAAVTRGLSVSFAPATATNQWRAWRVEMDVVEAGVATVEDF